jgi:hypothetical protein
MDKRQRDLFSALQGRYDARMLHVPVWVNKDQSLGQEFTQRTRSFLYSALGTVVATAVDAAGVRFFENGVVSLNLPIADEVLRARASRTTHPYVLDLFGRFYSALLDRDFVVDNPYLLKTKADVVSTIKQADADRLIPYTCSCGHGMFKSKTQWHCGTCSQCIDRRIAIIAAGAEENDPITDYISDVFTGPRRDGEEKNMVVNYVRHAMELYRMSEAQIAVSFDLELTRAVRALPGRSDAARCLIELHRRHAETVYSVLRRQLRERAGELVEGTLDPSSMLALIVGQQHLLSSWQRLCKRIVSILGAGLPITCASRKPDNEPHLQQICNGLLQGHGEDLTREFPFMRWSAGMVKPDWSDDALQLWIELKYVRKREDLHPITEAIAADITKYGDNRRRTLFIIYDPCHLITDEEQFSEPILRRAEMTISFIR